MKKNQANRREKKAINKRIENDKLERKRKIKIKEFKLERNFSNFYQHMSSCQVPKYIFALWVQKCFLSSKMQPGYKGFSLMI